ncbi:MAG: hypothetical protein ACLRWF_02440 [Ruthenibacterium sp.]
MQEQKKLFWQTYLTGAALAAAVLGAVAAFGGRGTAAFALGGGAGLAVALAAHACLFRAWGAAPNASGVVCWYLLRLGIVFGAVVLALFVPFADALGVLVLQLFCSAGAGRAPGAGEKRAVSGKGRPYAEWAAGGSHFGGGGRFAPHGV